MNNNVARYTELPPHFIVDRSKQLPTIRVSQTLYGNSGYAQKIGLVIRWSPSRRPGWQNPTIALTEMALPLTRF